MPASGKTTTAQLLVEDYKKNNKVLQILSTDNYICKIKFEKDSVLKNFINHKKIEFDVDSYNNSISKTKYFIEKFGENTFRDLELEYINDIIEENKNKEGLFYLDLGGKAPIHPKIKNLFKDNNIDYFIQISPSSDKVKENLKSDHENLKTRSNYQLYLDSKKDNQKNKEDIELLDEFHNKLKQERINLYDEKSDAIIIALKTEKPDKILERVKKMIEFLKEKDRRSSQSRNSLEKITKKFKINPSI